MNIFGRELARQRIGPLGDVAGAKEHDIIAGLGEGADDAAPDPPAFSSQAPDCVPVRLHGGDEAIAVGAFDRRFAGRIHIGDDHRIGVVERAANPSKSE